jgi:hypothetical protein
MQFEWDQRKNDANVRKHGLSFETAARVFGDPNFVLVKDRIDSKTGEQRWHAIGSASVEDVSVILLVVHAYRGTDGQETIRIISARKASQKERRFYFE